MTGNVKIAVFASGSGSNFAALEKACYVGTVPADIVLLVTDRPDAFAVERARQAGIPVAAFRPSDFDSKQAYEEAVLAKLREAGVEWLILAGYMRLISPVLLEAFPERIVNIHPSLLPSFPGKDAIGQALAAGVKVTGVTVHLVDEGMDTGPILAQQAVEVVEGDLKQTEKAVHAVEHELYARTLKELFREQ